MSKLVSNSDGIFVPEHTTHSQPKNVNRRNILSAIGAAGAGIALPSAVGLALSAPGQALAAAPLGKLIYTVPTSKQIVGYNSVEKSTEWWYQEKNAYNYKQVQAYTKTVEKKAGLSTTLTTYSPQSLARYTSTGMLIENAAGSDFTEVLTSNLTGYNGTCRRLNASGAENLDTKYAATAAGWKNFPVVKCVTLGTSAVEYLYKQYTDSQGKTYYRLFARSAAATAGLVVTVLIQYSGGDKEEVANVAKFIAGFTDVSAAKVSIDALRLTTGVLTTIGTVVGAATVAGAGSAAAACAAFTTALASGYAVNDAQYKFAAAMAGLETAINYFSQSEVPDATDCV